MDKDNSGFDFDNDQSFNENFYKNIEKAFEDATNEQQEQEKIIFPEGDTTDNDVTPDSMDNNRENPDVLEEAVSRENADTMESVADREVASVSENSAAQETATSSVDSDDVLKDNSEESVKEVSENSRSEMEDSNTSIEDELSDINDALAKQISEEMDNKSAQIAKMRKKRRFWKIQSGIMLTLLCLVGFGFFLGFTKPGTAVLMKLGVNLSGTLWDSMTHKFDDSTDVVEDIDYLDEDDLKSTAPEVDPSSIVWPDHPGEGRQEEGVYNILLLGEEQIGMGDGRGRTDVIVIATDFIDNLFKILKVYHNTAI